MTRAQTLVGYAVIVLAMAACQWAAARRGRTATFGQMIAWLARRGPTRWLMLGGWLWLGWHLFARTHWG